MASGVGPTEWNFYSVALSQLIKKQYGAGEPLLIDVKF